MKPVIIIAIAVVLFFGVNSAFADPHAIETVNDSGLNLECAADCYTPSTLTVDVGHIVTMTNTDETGVHTFTSGTVYGFTPIPDDKFDSGILSAGDSWDYNADTVGEYPYYCTLHVWMQGTLIVQEAAAEEEMQMEESMVEDKVMIEDEVMIEETMMEEVELMVTITDSAMGDGTHFDIEFSEIHVNYEIIATQNGETILQETGHAMEMTGANYHIDAVGSDESPIDIEIVSLGIGPPDAEDDWTGPTGTVATTQVVPEFGTIAMMVLAIAIISIVAVTAKSRVIPRF